MIKLFLASCVLSALALDVPAQNQGLMLTSGSTANVEMQASATLVPQSGITVEAWITYDDQTLPSGSRWPTIVRKNLGSNRESYFLRVSASNTNRTILDWRIRTTFGVSTLSWPFQSRQLAILTHVAATFDGSEAKIFVNGVEVAKRAVSGTLVDTGGVFRIGEGNSVLNPGAEAWHGAIDEVRLWPVARTAAEIRSTMNLELTSVPGEVSTWNLNVNGNDSSGSNSGVPTAASIFSPLALPLTPTSLTATVSFGAGTAGCFGMPLAGVSSAPRVGNSVFALTCIRSTATGAGVFGLSTARLPAPISVAGADLWIVPNGLILNVPGGRLGAVRTRIPIPAAGVLVGQFLFVQYFWTEATCPTQLFASDGLAIRILA